MNIGHVQGGTNAGWRRVKQPVEWTHTCTPTRASTAPQLVDVKVTLSSYSCPMCGARRPSAAA